MKHRTGIFMGLCLMLSASGHAVSFTRDSGDTSWTNLGQWNDNSSGSYQNSTNFPMSGDTILLNAGKTVTVDTNAAINTMVAPNATSDAFVELVSGGTLTASSFRVGNSSQAGNGTVNHFAGSLVATTLSLRPTGTKTGTYNLFSGTVSATNLEIGNSATSATGTSTFVQSGGTVTSPDIDIGASGIGEYKISGGTLNGTGTLDINATGRFEVAGSSAAISAGALDTQAGSELVFALDAAGVSAVQVSGNADLTGASIAVDGSSYWGGATNFTLLDAGSLVSMAGSVSITGLVSASVSQVGDSVVLNVVESKTASVFENTTGDGLWNTPGNWNPVGVPSGAVLARIADGLSATIATNPPAVAGIIVGDHATLALQAKLTVPELRFETDSALKLDLSALGLSALTVSSGLILDSTTQIIIDATDYEGLDGYFPLVLAEGLTGHFTNQVSFTGFNEREPAAIVEDDGLWLRVIAMPSLSERLCSLVPESRVAADYSNTTFSVTRKYDPSGSAWSVSFDEAHVLDTTLIQTAAHANQSWELRTGRGGFIYSLRTGGLGETVPPSWRSTQDASPWNDEVWQGVAVGPLNNPPDSRYFMHQSGVYLLRDPVLTKPFYSPQVASYLDEANRSFTTVNWTPQAHVNIYVDEDPSNDWKSYLLCYTRYRDLGQGVIEVMMGYYNYGPDLLDWFNMPWGGVRRTSTEYAFTSEPGGTTWRVPITNSWGSSEDFDETGGWQGFCNTSNGVTPALAFVFGQDVVPRLPGQKSDSWFRTGYAGGKHQYKPTETDWRNYLVSTAVRRYNLPQGNGIWSTHFYVLGDDMQDLSDRIQTRGLIGADLAAFNYTESNTPLVAYSVSGNGSSFQCLENGSSPDFFLYAHPVSGSFPIFEIIEDDGSRYLTWNPYANGIVKPYDGTMAGLRLLGFAMPSAGTNGTYAALDGLLPSENYLPDGETLFARTATPIETWRVEYFGFADDAADGANSANPDGDSANNLWEYGLGGNPTNAADIGYVATAGTLDEDGTNFMEYVYARRIGSEAELDYNLEAASNLVSNDWNTAEYTELPMAGSLDAEFEAVTNRIDTTGKTNEFIRLKIEAL
ncbi:hypothetical protein P4B35_05985 [Pontiellaceae bacterium B12227]|nr:hypothetical protein [Pontiellaceae bacterium B12227]